MDVYYNSKDFWDKIFYKNCKMVMLKAKNYQKLEILYVDRPFWKLSNFFPPKNGYNLYLLIKFIIKIEIQIFDFYLRGLSNWKATVNFKSIIWDHFLSIEIKLADVMLFYELPEDISKFNLSTSKEHTYENSNLIILFQLFKNREITLKNSI